MSAAELLRRASDLEAWRPGTPPGVLLRAAWSVRRTLPVRIAGVDVVRILSSTWAETRTALAEREIPCGPVLVNIPRACVEVIVPRRTAASWPALPTTRCVAGARMRCPAPSVSAVNGLHVDGRFWLYPPAPSLQAPEVTDGDALAEAVGVALARRVRRLRTLHDHPREGQQT
ncbi:hypothetical protein [Streptomyces sp. NPDC001492]